MSNILWLSYGAPTGNEVIGITKKRSAENPKRILYYQGNPLRESYLTQVYGKDGYEFGKTAKGQPFIKDKWSQDPTDEDYYKYLNPNEESKIENEPTPREEQEVISRKPIEQDISATWGSGTGVDLYSGQAHDKKYQSELSKDATGLNSIFGNRRTDTIQKNYYNPLYKEAWSDLFGNVMDGINWASAGWTNRLSPSQNIGLIIDTLQGDNFMESWMGNSGLVSDKFTQKHPYWSLLINTAGDGMAYGSKSIYKGAKNRFSDQGFRIGNYNYKVVVPKNRLFSGFGYPDVQRTPVYSHLNPTQFLDMVQTGHGSVKIGYTQAFKKLTPEQQVEMLRQWFTALPPSTTVNMNSIPSNIASRFAAEMGIYQPRQGQVYVVPTFTADGLNRVSIIHPHEIVSENIPHYQRLTSNTVPGKHEGTTRFPVEYPIYMAERTANDKIVSANRWGRKDEYVKVAVNKKPTEFTDKAIYKYVTDKEGNSMLVTSFTKAPEAQTKLLQSGQGVLLPEKHVTYYVDPSFGMQSHIKLTTSDLKALKQMAKDWQSGTFDKQVYMGTDRGKLLVKIFEEELEKISRNTPKPEKYIRNPDGSLTPRRGADLREEMRAYKNTIGNELDKITLPNDPVLLQKELTPIDLRLLNRSGYDFRFNGGFDKIDLRPFIVK